MENQKVGAFWGKNFKDFVIFWTVLVDVIYFFKFI